MSLVFAETIHAEASRFIHKPYTAVHLRIEGDMLKHLQKVLRWKGNIYEKLIDIGFKFPTNEMYKYFPPSMDRCEEYIAKCLENEKIQFEKSTFFGDSPFNLGENYIYLDKALPGSKFILTVRDPENWYNSILRWAKGKFHYYNIMYNFTKASKEDVIKMYTDRNEAVMRYFKDRSSDLLVMDVESGDGYKKLCPFLNIPCIEKPFPHNHKTK